MLLLLNMRRTISLLLNVVKDLLTLPCLFLAMPSRPINKPLNLQSLAATSVAPVNRRNSQYTPLPSYGSRHHPLNLLCYPSHSLVASWINKVNSLAYQCHPSMMSTACLVIKSYHMGQVIPLFFQKQRDQIGHTVRIFAR